VPGRRRTTRTTRGAAVDLEVLVALVVDADAERARLQRSRQVALPQVRRLEHVTVRVDRAVEGKAIDLIGHRRTRRPRSARRSTHSTAARTVRKRELAGAQGGIRLGVSGASRSSVTLAARAVAGSTPSVRRAYGPSPEPARTQAAPARVEQLCQNPERAREVRVLSCAWTTARANDAKSQRGDAWRFRCGHPGHLRLARLAATVCVGKRSGLLPGSSRGRIE
jgi:hypothetical protein